MGCASSKSAPPRSIAREPPQPQQLQEPQKPELPCLLGGDVSRGLGEYVCQVNHIAIVVRDVGESLHFYKDVIGFKQINRPNFDRHGAWLSMGNVELHLIKGMPNTRRGQHPSDLIVSHIALQVSDADAVLQKLRRLQEKQFKELHWRQNVSVPTFEASRHEVFESDHTNAKGKLQQFFIEDPDGYWVEICNCGEEEAEAESNQTRQGQLSVDDSLSIACRAARVTRRARSSLQARRLGGNVTEHAQATALPQVEVDRFKLSNLVSRRNTYGDICQGFSEAELQSALASAGNDVPKAVLILEEISKMNGGQVYAPPAFLDDSTVIHYTDTFQMVQMSIFDEDVVIPA